MFLEVLHFLALYILEGAHTLEHLIPIYLGAIKLRTIDADKLGLAADGETAGSAHTGTIYHDGIKRYISREIIFLGKEAAELHHDRRTDGEHLIYMFLVDEFLDAHGYYAFLAVASVIGHDDEFVAGCTHFIFHDDEVLASTSNHAEHSVACSFQCLDDREHWSHTYATTGTDHGTEVLDVGRVAEWSHHVVNLIALVQGAKLGRGESYLLYHQRDGTFLDVGIGDGQRHALAVVIYTDDDEVASLAALGDEWSFHIETEYLF